MRAADADLYTLARLQGKVAPDPKAGLWSVPSVKEKAKVITKDDLSDGGATFAEELREIKGPPPHTVQSSLVCCRGRCRPPD